MQQIEGILILGVTLAIVTAISIIRGIMHRVAMAAAQRRQIELAARGESLPMNVPGLVPVRVRRETRSRAA